MSEPAASASTPGGARGDEWKLLSLYMLGLSSSNRESVSDVLQLGTRTSKLVSAPQLSISSRALAAKEALQADPYNLRLMNNLAAAYEQDAQHEQCLNVLLRGWKRAGEIEDEESKFRFLMKACELSMGLWLWRQALAVFRDIPEPTEPNHLKPFHILGTQVWARNGDIAMSMKFFRNAIQGEEFALAVRIFAIVSLDVKRGGGYEVARTTIEGKVFSDEEKAELSVVDNYVADMEQRKPAPSPEAQKKTALMVAIGVSVMLMLAFLFWLEAKSLESMRLKS